MPANNAGNSSFENLRNRYEQLPRAGRWLVWFTVGMVAFFLIINPMLALTAKYNIASDNALRSIAKYAKDDEQIAKTIENGRKRWGTVLPPTADASRVLDAKYKITAVLEQNGIKREVAMIERPHTRVKTDQTVAGVQYMRGPIEVKFTARPHVAAAVLADIEALPEIAMVASVRLRRLADRAELETTIIADAWYTQKKEQ